MVLDSRNQMEEKAVQQYKDIYLVLTTVFITPGKKENVTSF